LLVLIDPVKPQLQKNSCAMNGWRGVYINPDIIAEEKYGGWNSREAIIKAANYAKEIRENCQNLW
jgi:hypothetical protein